MVYVPLIIMSSSHVAVLGKKYAALTRIRTSDLRFTVPALYQPRPPDSRATTFSPVFQRDIANPLANLCHRQLKLIRTPRPTLLPGGLQRRFNKEIIKKYVRDE